MLKKILVLVFVLVGLSSAGLLWLWPTWNQDSSAPDGVLDQPRPLTAFSLQRHEQPPLDVAALQGKWTFIYFGYTHCPDVCPTTISELNAAHGLLAADPGVLDDTRFVFISVDPERDTPATLATYVAYFNETFSGATGSHDALATLTRQLGIEHSRGKASDGDYVVNHSSAVLLIDPQVRYYARLKAPHYSEKIRSQFLAIRHFYENSYQGNP